MSNKELRVRQAFGIAMIIIVTYLFVRQRIILAMIVGAAMVGALKAYLWQKKKKEAKTTP